MVAVCHWCQSIRDMTQDTLCVDSCGVTQDKYRIYVVTGSQKQVACGVDGFVSRAEEQSRVLDV